MPEEPVTAAMDTFIAEDYGGNVFIIRVKHTFHATGEVTWELSDRKAKFNDWRYDDNDDSTLQVLEQIKELYVDGQEIQALLLIEETFIVHRVD